MDQAHLTVGLSGLRDAAGNALVGTNSLVVRNLRSDVDQSGLVNIVDQSKVKAALNQPVGASNFWLDVNNDGLINVLDQSMAKGDLGHAG